MRTMLCGETERKETGRMHCQKKKNEVDACTVFYLVYVCDDPRSRFTQTVSTKLPLLPGQWKCVRNAITQVEKKVSKTKQYCDRLL